MTAWNLAIEDNEAADNGPEDNGPEDNGPEDNGDEENGAEDNELIAILRGLTPGRAEAVSDVLVEAGFRCIEVPLNSPKPLSSIEVIARKHGGNTVVGAGTVLNEAEVTEVVNAGGQIIVAPDLNSKVGHRAIALGAKWCPGVLTPSEAFAALELGASILKFFPAELVSPAAIKAIRAVTPREANIAVVGRCGGALWWGV